jgi:hypothetical protein
MRTDYVFTARQLVDILTDLPADTLVGITHMDVAEEGLAVAMASTEDKWRPMPDSVVSLMAPEFKILDPKI